MIVVIVSVCPPSLRGDITKWLIEVSNDVFVGRVTSRVRDEIWNRIVDNCANGRAVMVYPTNSEQHFSIRLHNSNMEAVDFDGLTLMRKPHHKTIRYNRVDDCE